MGVQLSQPVCDALLVGAITDTFFGVFGDTKKKIQALEDLTSLVSLGANYSQEFINTFNGLTMEQEVWLTQVYPHIVMHETVLILSVPDELTQDKSLTFLRSTLQGLTHKIPATAFLWGYQNEGTRKYSARSDRFNVVRFAEQFGTGGGHVGAASFKSDKPPEEIFDSFIKYISEQ